MVANEYLGGKVTELRRTLNQLKASRKERPVSDNWSVEVAINDAVEDLEAKIAHGFAHVSGQIDLNIDEWAKETMSATRTMDLSGTKMKPARKKAERIYIKTKDFDLARSHALSKALGYLRSAQAEIARKSYAKAFRHTLMASEEYCTYQSISRYVQTRAIETTSASRAKLARDPKQTEKALVHSCWGEWQKKPESYKGKAAFARDMLDKCEHLTSQKKIEDWCRKWEKETSPS